ncbi:SERTA domain-containing protein 3 [Pristis pectinata]|uniref:SERTA domain-containing protein 3 n=1 Tax=Pristis pectinata TaxID=685728 RepID=UPI00223DE596|nr:SERTA domain-containing protein 3 [Pristis pectinata]
MVAPPTEPGPPTADVRRRDTQALAATPLVNRLTVVLVLANQSRRHRDRQSERPITARERAPPSPIGSTSPRWAQWERRRGVCLRSASLDCPERGSWEKQDGEVGGERVVDGGGEEEATAAGGGVGDDRGAENTRAESLESTSAVPSTTGPDLMQGKPPVLEFLPSPHHLPDHRDLVVFWDQMSILQDLIPKFYYHCYVGCSAHHHYLMVPISPVAKIASARPLRSSPRTGVSGPAGAGEREREKEREGEREREARKLPRPAHGRVARQLDPGPRSEAADTHRLQCSAAAATGRGGTPGDPEVTRSCIIRIFWAVERLQGTKTCRGIPREESMAAVRFTPGKGVKRKRAEEDGALPPPIAFRCDSLLDLSLLKLHQSCMVSERNLRRSVLIANALRRLQADGGLPVGLPAHQPQPVSKPEAADLNNNRAEANSSLLSGNDSSLSSAISTILQDLDYMEGLGPSREQPAPEEDQLLPLRPGSPNPRPLDSIFAAFEISNSDAFLVDGSLDAIFEDIDTSMYDAQPGLSAGLWDPLKPPASAPAPCPLAKASWDCSSTRTSNSRTDFADLESVMDLLVG